MNPDHRPMFLSGQPIDDALFPKNATVAHGTYTTSCLDASILNALKTASLGSRTAGNGLYLAMPTAPNSIRRVLVLIAAISCSGCTRTYDGTVVPTYQVKLVRTGIPHISLQPALRGPTYQPASFPPAPRPPASMVPVRSPRQITRGPAGPLPSSIPNRAFDCKPKSAAGRVSVVCDPS